MTDEDKLASLLEEGAIDEVLGNLQSGKEASLYAVRRGTEVAAAKIYKERDRRTFKNNAVYREGRKVRNSRDERAVARGSRHGKVTQESSWRAAESETLSALHAAGVRVPRPIAFHDGVLLMELVTDARGERAPRLIDVRPTREEARAWHAVLVREIVKMLLVGWVHGDLSAYNILIAASGPVIIDFPQAVSAAHNGQARALLERDVRNVTEFLAGFDPGLAPLRGQGADIWGRYERGNLVPELVAEATPSDMVDELALQIAAAKAMPVERVRQRRTPGPTRPKRPKGERSPRKEDGGSRLWSFLADRYDLGDRQRRP